MTARSRHGAAVPRPAGPVCRLHPLASPVARRTRRSPQPPRPQLAFWRRTLAGMPEELRSPVDHPRPQAAGHRGGTVPMDLDSGLHRRLLALAHDSRPPCSWSSRRPSPPSSATRCRRRHPHRHPHRRPTGNRPSKTSSASSSTPWSSAPISPAIPPSATHRAGPRLRPRRLRAPGSPLPSPGRGRAAHPLPRPQPAVPGHARPPERPRGRGRPARAPAGGGRMTPEFARFDLTFHFRNPGTPTARLGRRRPGIQPRPLRRPPGRRRSAPGPLLAIGRAHPDVPLHRLDWLGDQERHTLPGDLQRHRPAGPRGQPAGLFEAQVRRSPSAPAWASIRRPSAMPS